MQQQHLSKPTYKPSSSSRWVVDSKPLEQGKHNVAMVHGGCNADPCCAAPPVIEKKN